MFLVIGMNEIYGYKKFFLTAGLFSTKEKAEEQIKLLQPLDPYKHYAVFNIETDSKEEKNLIFFDCSLYNDSGVDISPQIE